VISLLLKSAAILLLAFPVTFVVTIATFPFWRWLDVSTQIESFGHSGPAEWCFWLVYAFLVSVSFAAWRTIHGRSELQ